MGGMAPLSVVPCAEGWSGSVTWHPDMHFAAEEETGNRYMGNSAQFAEIIRSQLKKNVEIAKLNGATGVEQFYQKRWDDFGVNDVHAEAAVGLVMLQIALEKSGRNDATAVAEAMSKISFNTFFGKIQLDKDGWNMR